MSKEAMKRALEALELVIADVKTTPSAYEAQRQAITALREALASEAIEQPKFTKHTVEQTSDWSEWVCPDPKGYLMKCCDCGLVHEAEFGVVRYKSETEREDCDRVDDPNLQAVFRMRRSEQWSPEDTAHRAGGMPMAQPAQQKPVNLRRGDLLRCIETDELCTVWATSPTGNTLIKWSANNFGNYTAEQIGELFWLEPAQQEHVAIVAVDGLGQIQVGWITKPQHNDKLYTSPPAQRTWVSLTDVERHECTQFPFSEMNHRAIEAKLKEKNNG